MGLAWLAAVASLTLAVLTLYPRGERSLSRAAVVHAADERVARSRDEGASAAAAAPLEARRAPAALLGAPLEEAAPPRLLCRVVDEYDLPVAGAEVWADDGEYALRGLTDEQGGFSLVLDPTRLERRWRRGEVVLVGARHARHGPSLLAAWSGPHETETLLRLHGAGARLVVQVVDVAGAPVAGAELEVTPGLRALDAPLASDGRSARVTPGARARTDAWGEVRFQGLEPGASNVHMSAEGFCSRVVVLRLDEGETLRRRLTLDASSALRGQLLMASGRPAAGARVTATHARSGQRAEVRADRAGSFSFSRLPVGRLHLSAELYSGDTISHGVEDELTLRADHPGWWSAVLEPIEHLEGRLLDHEGWPLVGWRLELQALEEREEPLHVTHTDEDGRYVLPEVAQLSGSRLLLYHPEAAGGIPTRVLDDPRSLRDEAELRLNPGEERSSTLFGRVRSQDGRPAVGLPLRLHRLGTHQSLSLTSSLEDASFQTPPLPPGDYVLVFPTHGRGWIPDARFTVSGDHALDVGSLRLPNLGRVHLAPSVPTRSGECREIRLVLRRPELDAEFTYVVHEGRVDLPLEFDLSPGQYTLQATDAPGAPRVDFTLASAGQARVVVPCE